MTVRFDVLSRELNVFEPHFLEASAGTGKTFAIEHLVTRCLIETKDPLTIEQILVVTFTKAATRELKLRIRRCLTRAKEELITNSPAADYLKAICEKGESVTKEAIYRIDAALICYDSAQIYTLHGFCHRVLKEFAFEAGTGLEMSDPEEKEHLALLESTVKDHLKNTVISPEYSPGQIQRVLNKYRGDVRKFIAKLVGVISSGKEIASFLNFQELLDAFLQKIHSLPNIDRALLKEDIEKLRPLYKGMTSDEIPSQIQFLCEILETKSCTHHAFDQLLQGDFFLEKMHEKNKKVRAFSQTELKLNYPCLIDRLHTQLVPLIETAKDASMIFLRLAKDSQNKCQILLESLEKFSPDALLLKVERALQKPLFIERVSQKYQAAIIDEFQDTDPIQWNIFQKLFLNSARAICLVGDPKQSIYSFRNADVYTYLSAACALGSTSKKYLDTNFRSTTSLVEALNQLFSKAQEGWMALPELGSMLEVISVKASDTAQSESQVPLQFFVSVGKKGRAKKFPTSEMFEKKIFPFIFSEILSSEAKLHEIAILVKDRFQAQEIVSYLTQRGIPAHSKRGGMITESVAYFALKELLLAVCSPNDTSCLKAALGGPCIFWGAEQLNRGLDDPFLLRAKSQMQVLNHTLFCRGFGAFFYDFLNTAWGQTTLLEEMLERGELPLYLHLRQLLEILLEEETLHRLKGEAFLKCLEDLAIEAQYETNRLKIASSEAQNSVTVMTVHMSKGLEFDTVFALGLASRHKMSETIVVKESGQSVMRIFNPEDPACQLAVEELDAEKMRQLYVSLTRAKRRLYVPLIVDEDQKPIEYAEASAVELFFARMIQSPSSHLELYKIAQQLTLKSVKEILDPISPQIRYQVLDSSEALHCELPSKSTPLLIPQEPLTLPLCNQQLFSFSALAKKDRAKETIRQPKDDCLSPHTLPLGSQTGHILHLLFEKIFKRGLHNPLNPNAIFDLIQEEISFTALAKWQPILLLWIEDILNLKITTFALVDLPRNQLQQEMEFFFRVEGGMMKGFADLFFEYEGKYYLLDWKSNYLGPCDADYTEKNMIEAMEQNDYFLQASIYAEALRRYVKLFDNRPFSECFGGALYYFIRGRALYHFIPEPKVFL